MTNVTCAWLVPQKTSHIDSRIVGLQGDHETSPLVASTPWKQNLDKRDRGDLFIGNTWSFPPHLIKLPKFGYYWEAIPYGPFGWTWMTLPSLTPGEMQRRHNKSTGKTYLNTLELHWVWHGKIQIGLPFMMTWSTNRTKFGEGMNFSTA